MTPDRFRECLSDLEWSQRAFARVFHRDEGNIRQMARGATQIPGEIERFLETIMEIKPVVSNVQRKRGRPSGKLIPQSADI